MDAAKENRGIRPIEPTEFPRKEFMPRLQQAAPILPRELQDRLRRFVPTDERIQQVQTQLVLRTHPANSRARRMICITFVDTVVNEVFVDVLNRTERRRAHADPPIVRHVRRERQQPLRHVSAYERGVAHDAVSIEQSPQITPGKFAPFPGRRQDIARHGTTKFSRRVMDQARMAIPLIPQPAKFVRQPNIILIRQSNPLTSGETDGALKIPDDTETRLVPIHAHPSVGFRVILQDRHRVVGGMIIHDDDLTHALLCAQ